jgi:hypothetical protein
MRCTFFVVSGPEVMAEAGAVIKNLLKVWRKGTCMFCVVSSPEVKVEADAVIKNLLKVGYVVHRRVLGWLRV